ncbi:MAG: hypothetical protein LC772_02695 [Chloroflexi bacterium]|nr:hypothetical protein [Chloroflexota bacterium]
MQLNYDDRSEMQRSLKRAGLREVFLRHKEGTIKITALIDSQSMALCEFAGNQAAFNEEIVSWKSEHFEVLRGEVVLQPAAGQSAPREKG